MLGRTILFICLLPAFLALSCGKIPTDPNSTFPLNELAYVNNEWGFQVSRPSEAWGLNVQTFELIRESNGKARVEVRMSRPFIESAGTLFRPEMFLQPAALNEITTLEDLVVSYEGTLKDAFEGYTQQGEKRRVNLGNDEALQWQFRKNPFTQNRRFPGTRFLAAVVVRNREAYFMLGNGVRGDFPQEGYRAIVRSLRFVDR
ncbi:MAG: hypothetical protein O7G87_18190 [bacterium]|nr:hypothetical protein [bacterium]